MLARSELFLPLQKRARDNANIFASVLAIEWSNEKANKMKNTEIEKSQEAGSDGIEHYKARKTERNVAHLGPFSSLAILHHGILMGIIRQARCKPVELNVPFERWFWRHLLGTEAKSPERMRKQLEPAHTRGGVFVQESRYKVRESGGGVGERSGVGVEDGPHKLSEGGVNEGRSASVAFVENAAKSPEVRGCRLSGAVLK
jgi:hypothetical protein